MMRLEWRFERELGIMFGVEFKGNEEYFSQLSSGTQSLPKVSYCLPTRFARGRNLLCRWLCKKRVSEFIPGTWRSRADTRRRKAL